MEHHPTRRLRTTLLAALAVALVTAPNAHGAVITPSNGRYVGEAWAQLYSLPFDVNPLAGNGNPCLTVGRDVLEAVDSRPCTVKAGTAIMLFLGSAWSNAEAPYPADEAAQRAVALAADQGVSEIQVSVDGGDPVWIRRRRFELFSPQRTVRLPADNILDAPAQTITLTAHGWSALVRCLRPGSHTIVVNAVLNGAPISAPHFIRVLPGGAGRARSASAPRASGRRG